MRDPLLVFLAFGAAVFAVDAWWAPPEDVGGATIVVTDDVIAERARELAVTHGRPPTGPELRDAVDRWLTEEVLVREARSRGLDRVDPIVRRHLAERMSLVVEGGQVPDEPTDDALRALYEAHRDAYAHPTLLTVRQVFAADRATAEALAARWQAGEDPRELGEAPPGGPVLRARTPERLAERYGEAFAAAVAGLAPGERAIVASPEGWHVVQLDKRQDGGALSFDDARLRLRARWQRERLDEATARAVAALRGRYTVEGWPR